MTWERLTHDAIQQRVVQATGANLSYRSKPVLGFPGSFLDRDVFPPLPELSKHAWLACLQENPNHIGCHTLGASEAIFAGTQQLERELISMCAEGLLGAPAGQVDGYVAAGGTESNIQAVWTYRNRFQRLLGVRADEVALLCSADTHYSAWKAANITGVRIYPIPVEPRTRRMARAAVERCAEQAIGEGARCAIVFLNMGTTMFGSIDQPDDVLPVLEALGLPYEGHVDGAFGGFIYPLTAQDNPLSFADERLTSFTLDGHKMLQAPYGTGIHLVRRGYIGDVLCDQAQYVSGLDCTLSGSRSGASAVAMWMILSSYGYEGGREFCMELVRRTDTLCRGLQAMGVQLYRHPQMNVIAMDARAVPPAIAERFWLVPDRHDGSPSWYKIVVMDHVSLELIEIFLEALRVGQRPYLG